MSRLGWTECVCLACYCVQSHTCVLYARMPSVHSGSFIFPAVNQAGKKKKKCEVCVIWNRCSPELSCRPLIGCNSVTPPQPPPNPSLLQTCQPPKTHMNLYSQCVCMCSALHVTWMLSAFPAVLCVLADRIFVSLLLSNVFLVSKHIKGQSIRLFG